MYMRLVRNQNFLFYFVPIIIITGFFINSQFIKDALIPYYFYWLIFGISTLCVAFCNKFLRKKNSFQFLLDILNIVFSISIFYQLLYSINVKYLNSFKFQDFFLDKIFINSIIYCTLPILFLIFILFVVKLFFEQLKN